MMKFVSLTDFLPVVPELILIATVILLVLVDLFGPSQKHHLATVSITGLVAAFAAEWCFYQYQYTGFWETVVMDPYSILFESLYIITALITILFSVQYVKDHRIHTGEYYILLLCAVVGMMFMTSGLDMLLIFVGLEIMSISSYILVGILRQNTISKEASLKYLLLGAFSSGFLLYGISLLYGATGSIYLPEIVSQFHDAEQAANPLMPLGLGLIIVGLCFKIAIVPFHMWVPDVYTGAPTPVTAFLSAASKAAGFAVFVRIFLTGMPLNQIPLESLFAIMAILTMSVGNFMALKQDSVKRMLAYSSVTHAGYVMVAMATGSPKAVSSIIFYSFSYAVMATGAFGILSMRSNGKNIETYDDFRGYAKQSPWRAAAMTLFMLSMLGLPLTGGFIAKYQIFSTALESGFLLLAIIGIINSAISIYYYIRVIVYMYMKEESPTTEVVETPVSNYATAGLWVSALAIIYLGMFPNLLIRATYQSVNSLLY